MCYGMSQKSCVMICIQLCRDIINMFYYLEQFFTITYFNDVYKFSDLWSWNRHLIKLVSTITILVEQSFLSTQSKLYCTKNIASNYITE